MKKRMSAAIVAGVALSWAPVALADASQDAMYRIDQKTWSRPRNGSSDEAQSNIHQQVWHRATSDAPIYYTDQARGIWGGTPDMAPYVTVDLRSSPDRMAEAPDAQKTPAAQGTGAAEQLTSPATAQ